MINKKMLAVRLPPNLVDAVKSYAASEGKSIAIVVEEFIRIRLAQINEGTQGIKEDTDLTNRKELFHKFREARKRGEVLSSKEKKMLVARLPPELVDAVKNWAIAENQNIAVVVEKLIYLELLQRKSELVKNYKFDEERKEPFRRRKSQKSIFTDSK